MFLNSVVVCILYLLIHKGKLALSSVINIFKTELTFIIGHFNNPTQNFVTNAELITLT